MVSRALARAALVVLATTLPSAGCSSESKKPIVMDWMTVDYTSRPATLDETVRSTDAIIVGRAQFSRTDHNESRTLRTVYAVTIADLIRSHPALTGKRRIEVYQIGGDIDEGNRIKRQVQRGFPPLVPGQDLVLFLNWNPQLGAFEVIWPESVYVLGSDGTVHAYGEPLRLAKAQDGRRANEFIDNLKRSVTAQGLR